MSLVFRELTNEEETILQTELDYWLEEKELLSFKKENSFLIAEGKWCELVITTKKVGRFFKENAQISPYSIGITFGEIKNRKILLSLGGAEELCTISRKKLKINETAEQLFLYQRDILSKSIIEYPTHVNKGQKILVTNPQGDCLGVGQLLLSREEVAKVENAERIAVKNLKDLGWYLRKGK
ncbi:MAG: NIP7 pre-PUA domain-containing protein [Candidatus Heimdallarchaeota archaeon]